MRDYIDLLTDYKFPKLLLIKGIGSHSLSTIQNCEGRTWFLPNGDKEIDIFLTYQQKYSPHNGNQCNIKKKPFSTMDLLITLAHELSHVATDFDHTPNHKIIECKILIIFMKKLLKDGYISEEIELGTTDYSLS